MPEGKPEQALAGLLGRALESLRVVRRHWSTFVVVAGLCIFATWLVTWLCLSQQAALLKSQNALLQDRINAFASTPPSQWRHLGDRARGLLLAGLEHPDNHFKVLIVYATADSESRKYSAQFVDGACSECAAARGCPDDLFRYGSCGRHDHRNSVGAGREAQGNSVVRGIGRSLLILGKTSRRRCAGRFRLVRRAQAVVRLCFLAAGQRACLKRSKRAPNRMTL